MAETNYDQKLRDLPSILVALLCLRHPDNLKEIVWATLRYGNCAHAFILSHSPNAKFTTPVKAHGV